MEKNRDLFKALRMGALSLSLSFLIPFAVVSAQNNNNNATNTNATNTTTTTTNRAEVRDDRRDNDDDTDWGWLGLLGLAGLLGLMPKKRVPVVHETREVRDRAPDTNRR